MINPIDVYKEFKEFIPSKSTALKAAYNQIKYGNNWERVIFDNTTPIRPAEKLRYAWANEILTRLHITGVVDFGCGCGYGCRLFPRINYMGIDYDAKIIKFAKKEYSKMASRVFIDSSITNFFATFVNFQERGAVLFEIVEHLVNGIALANTIKSKFRTTLISVPWNEPVGYWGPHHKLHNLTTKDFPGWISTFLDMQTGEFFDNEPTINISKEYKPILMLLHT